MGCDIHIVLERKETQSEWLGIWTSDIGPGKRRDPVARRDYEFFAEVAAVRGSTETTTYPRNIPVDVSRLAWLQPMRAPTDHHSPSHMALDEFCEAWFRVNKETPDIRKEFAAADLFGIDPAWPEGCAYRVVFWFDN